MIGNLKDNEGNSHSVEEIVPEKLLLNYLVHPQPWRFGQGGKPISAILNNMGSSRQAPPVRGLLRHTWSGFKKGPLTTKNSERHEQEVKESADYAISDRTAG